MTEAQRLADSKPTSIDDDLYAWADEAADELRRLDAENAAMRDALHRISLCSQNSMSSKIECGRIARAALSGTAPAPARVPLTDEQIDAIGAGIFSIAFLDVEEVLANREIARAIEAAHGITGDAA